MPAELRERLRPTENKGRTKKKGRGTEKVDGQLDGGGAHSKDLVVYVVVVVVVVDDVVSIDSNSPRPDVIDGRVAAPADTTQHSKVRPPPKKQ